MMQCYLQKLKTLLTNIFFPALQITQSYLEDEISLLLVKLKYSENCWHLVDLCWDSEQLEKFKCLPIAIGISDSLIHLSHIQVPVEISNRKLYSYLEENLAEYFPFQNIAQCYWDFYSDEDHKDFCERRVTIVLAEKQAISGYMQNLIMKGWLLSAIEPWCFVIKREIPSSLFSEISRQLPSKFSEDFIKKSIQLAMRSN